MLSLGPQAPWWVDNSSQFLGPFNTRQAEMGAKYEPGQRILLLRRSFTCARRSSIPRCIQAPDSFCPAVSLRSRRSVLRVRGPRDAQRRRVERGGQGRKLAAAHRLGHGHQRRLHRYGHAGLRQQAGDQRAAPAHNDVCRCRCAPHARPAPDARLELHQPQRSHARRHGERAQLQPLQPGSALHDPAASRAASHFISTPTTSLTSVTGATPARVMATRSSGWVRRRRCGFRHTTLSRLSAG